MSTEKMNSVKSESEQFTALGNVDKKSEKQSKDLSSLASLRKELELWVSENESRILEIHNAIIAKWKMNKDRSLATVESAIRGIGQDIERLSISIPKLGSDKISDTTNGSKFAKPR